VTEDGPAPACDVWIVRLTAAAQVGVDADEAERTPGAGEDARATLAAARALLDAEEVGRADRFRRPADRDRFVGAHAALRAVLAPHAGRPPAELSFGREACPLCGEPHGRPRLVGDGADAGADVGVHFSLSHTDGVAAIAVARRPVGVDVESTARQADLDDLDGALHPSERRAVSALPAADRRLAVLRCWVRKEAYLKAIGTGLGLDPATVDVGLAGHDAPQADAGPDRWVLTDLPAGDGHVAAVAGMAATDTPLRTPGVTVHETDLPTALAGLRRGGPVAPDGFPRLTRGTSSASSSRRWST
jgi:4'-phosphopantetheinyl transferase